MQVPYILLAISFFFIFLSFTMQIIVGISKSNEEKELHAIKQIQIEAVERGLGEWEVSTDGTIQFKWKEVENE